MKKLVILLSVFTLTACSTQSKPVEHKEKHKVVKVKKKKTTQPSSNSSSSSSSSSTAPSSSSETQTQTAPVEQAPAPAQSQPQAGTGGAYIDGQGTWTEQDKTNETAPSATPSQQWHDDQVQWAQDQGLIDQNGNPTNGQ